VLSTPEANALVRDPFLVGLTLVGLTEFELATTDPVGYFLNLTVPQLLSKLLHQRKRTQAVSPQLPQFALSDNVRTEAVGGLPVCAVCCKGLNVRSQLNS
jgi:hypothetical protein